MAPDPRLDQDAAPSPVEAAGSAAQVVCPRCGATSAQRFYGPCDTCRRDLRAALAGEQRAVEAPQYEPKMNVTPNAVATKD
jgi:hypothetical protein